MRYLALLMIALTDGHCAGIQFNTTDSNAQSWAKDSSRSNSIPAHGTTISSRSYMAATRFMLNIKRWGLRSQITQCQLYLGNGVNACAAPIIDDNSNKPVLVNFVSGDFVETSGLT